MRLFWIIAFIFVTIKWICNNLIEGKVVLPVTDNRNTFNVTIYCWKKFWWLYNWMFTLLGSHIMQISLLEPSFWLFNLIFKVTVSRDQFGANKIIALYLKRSSTTCIKYILCQLSLCRIKSNAQQTHNRFFSFLFHSCSGISNRQSTKRCLSICSHIKFNVGFLPVVIPHTIRSTIVSHA